MLLHSGNTAILGNTITINGVSTTWTNVNNNYYEKIGGIIECNTTRSAVIIKQKNSGSYNQGLRIYATPTSPWSGILLGGSDLTSDSDTSNKSYWIGNEDGKFCISKGSAGNTAISLYCNGSDWYANTYKLYHTGNLNLNTLGGQPAGNYVTYSISTPRATVDGTNNYPGFYNLEGNELISGYLNYYYIINLGKHTYNNYAAQIAVPYQNTVTDSDLFVRVANGSSWRTWRKMLHTGNSSVSGNTITINGVSTTWINSTYNF